VNGPQSGIARQYPTQDPPSRVVLLGASNLARGFSTVVETAWQVCGRPLDIVTALGHGRSYGMDSWFLGRRLPAIRSCGLWNAVGQAPPAPTFALVTDIGNDLMFQAPVERIVGWVDECFDRLDAIGARVVVTRLPLANLTTLSSARFLLLRSLFYPRCRLSLAEVARRGQTLDDELARRAAGRGYVVVKPPSDWFGFDPIHIKLKFFSSAWLQIFSSWSDAEQLPSPARGSLGRWMYLRALVPAERRWLLFEQRRRQPAGRFVDGTTVALY
jgi:hypothetical protein